MLMTGLVYHPFHVHARPHVDCVLIRRPSGCEGLQARQTRIAEAHVDRRCDVVLQSRAPVRQIGRLPCCRAPDQLFMRCAREKNRPFPPA